LLHPSAEIDHCAALRCNAIPSVYGLPPALYLPGGSAIDASPLHLSMECNTVHANVYQATSEPRDEGSGGAGQDMQAGAIGTDVHATKTAGAGAGGYAEPTTGRPRESHRLHRPRRSGESRPLASVPLEPVRGGPHDELEAFEHALALAGARASAAYDAQEGWLDGVRAGLVALFEFFDQEPALARYLVVHSTQAGAAVLERRSEVLDRLARVLDDERAPARGYPPPLTAQAVVSGVLGVLYERLSKRDPGALVDLAGSLMSFIVMPFLGARAARRELARFVEVTPTPLKPGLALEALRDAGGRLNHRAVSVLTVIGSEPGLNSRELASRDGVKDEGQMSRLLSRLERLGLIENTRDPQRRGDVKAWQLTIALDELEAAISYEPPAPPHSVAFDLMRASGGRLKDRAISVLRVIGSEPNLSNNQVAVRVGLTDENRTSQLLARLARRGLLENTRTGGRENVWRLTPSGDELERAIWHETPSAVQRSLALNMLQVRGGRLNHRVVSVLRVIAANPGLSNNDIALRVGIEGKGDASTLLTRLVRFGLIENTRTRGRENEWRLIPAGKELERAIHDDSRRVK
jgi:DNA-binding MarR family transcriptional regulator